MLLESSSEDLDCESLLEMINGYFRSPVSKTEVKDLVEEFESVKGKTPKSSSPVEMTNDLKKESISTSRLNADAEAFCPVKKKTESKCNDLFFQEQDLADFIGSYLEDPKNDPVELLLQMFPSIPRIEIDALFQSNDQRFSLTLEALLQAKNSGSLSPDSEQDLHPTSLDLSTEEFPELQSCQRTWSTGSSRSESSKQSFLDVARKKPISPQQTSPAVSGLGLTTSTGFSYRKPKTPNGTIPWVITGEAVSKQYAKLRADASEFAKLRNACFSEATKAYVSGNKALAKELGEKGRMYCEKMKNCHFEASEAIFKDRNQQLRNMMDENSPEAIDLHGLHVAEARRILERELGIMRSKKVKGRQKIVSLLVGTGHHTKGARTPSRLPAAVENFLQESGFTFRRATPGVIEVDI